MICGYCNQENCTGEIQDHCTWCGGPYPPEEHLSIDDDRFCCDECFSEHGEFEKETS